VAVFEKLFQALFSYRPVVFQQGDFRFDITTASFVAAGIAALIMGAAIFTYRTVGGNGRPRDKFVLTALRIAALALVAFCLFRPTLVVKAAIPQQNVVAVLMDDSRSMQISDWNTNQPRAEFLRQELAGNTSPLLKSLSERFLVRTFRFSSASQRVNSVKDLSFSGSQTKIGAALDGVREELAGLPVAGIVLVTDGADTAEGTLTNTLLNLKAEKLPVFTVGVGSAKLPRDIQIDRISTPRTVLKGASLLVDAVITQSGYSGQTVTLDVEDDGRIVGSQKVTFPVDGSPASVRVRATASVPGPRVFTFKVAPQQSEVVTQNNQRDSLVEVRDTREKILYFEGEPRSEMKFIRRAVADDKNLQIVTLQRTADNKFLRLDVDTPDELLGGFPKTRDELFAFKGLILGSIEAAAFSADQLQMIADFVDKRGGGLLMLGGARSFGEGGYGNTPVADALPVLIDPKANAQEPNFFARLKVLPTRAGEAHAVTQIAGSEDASARRWPELPQVTSINSPLAIKPAATVLLNGTDERNRTIPMLVWQPYGRGKGIAFLPQDSWEWQMHASIPLEDMTHENLWRQMLRWLVADSPKPVEATTTVDRVEPGEAVTIEASVVDPSWVELNDAHVMARVTRPGGTTLDVPLQWTGERDGQYRGMFVSTEAGAYEVTVDATQANATLGSGTGYVRAAPGDAEYFDPVMHAAPLRRIAEETGGKFYTPASVSNIAEDVRYGGRGVTAVEQRELWNMPIILMALMGLACVEWGYRRLVGLV
jgi:uncharacterized membrane protein